MVCEPFSKSKESESTKIEGGPTIGHCNTMVRRCQAVERTGGMDARDFSHIQLVYDGPTTHTARNQLTSQTTLIQGTQPQDLLDASQPAQQAVKFLARSEQMRRTAVDVLNRLEAIQSRQETYLAAVKRGEFSNQWVDDILQHHDCEISD